MTLIPPRTPAGTLELLPREQKIFQFMLDTIRKEYERFGFVQIETPVFEVKDVLLTKSGGETEKQVYLVQSTGGLAQGHEADMALRFDLTVPLARYVAEHERELAFPFRRYQIQRVYRGERAQRGRFREFYQCDIDVIGKDKLDCAFDAELPAIIAGIFQKLGVGDFTIHFSNRKILLGILEAWNITDTEKQKLILREIDKLDKMPAEKILGHIVAHGMTSQQAGDLLALTNQARGSTESLTALHALNITAPIFQEGLGELTQMVAMLKTLGIADEVAKINLRITRGLDYYTGTVYETFINAHPEFGSVCSGGRYENLASFYTKSKLPGVGISIGLTRLFQLLADNNLLPKATGGTDILITRMDERFAENYLQLARTLREAGFNVENYLEPAKLDKQLKYADKSGIPFVIMMGEDEMRKQTVLLKDLNNKTQVEIVQANLADDIKKIIRHA